MLMKMLLYLSPAMLLLSVRILQAGAVAAPTFKVRDPGTGSWLECTSCPPGTYMQSPCTAARETQCSPCPSGSFTELWNHISRCLRCGVCGHNQLVKAACSSTSDCLCQCTEGHYYKSSYDMCLRHSECQSGHGALRKGTPDNDTVCQVCPDGTYSSSVSAQDGCMEHKSCTTAGLKLLLKGSTWHNSVCVNCQNLKSRGGAEYLKEILPAFFEHHRPTLRRLRRVVQKLHDPKKPIATSGLNLQALHEHLKAWIATATESQIYLLPGILSEASLDVASERLQNKLQRIDVNLKELCFGNEVEK